MIVRPTVAESGKNTSFSKPPLYTAEQRHRRDTTRWTLVQGVLAPLQFAVFLVSLFLVFKTLMTGEGYVLSTYSIVLKTLILYVIMITGAIWEKVVFGKYLFAEAFFWEDVFSMLVLTLHTAYLYGLFFTDMSQTSLLILALAAYAAYLVNAVQFVWKLRLARLEASAQRQPKSEANLQHTSENNPQVLSNIPELGAPS